MKHGISYGICVSDGKYLNQIISSIAENHVMDENYEIIFADQKDWWITKKKNWLAKQAQYDKLCLIHDYVNFPTGWYHAIKGHFGSLHQNVHPCDVVMTEVVTKEGKRGPDWLLNPNWMERFFKEIPGLSDVVFVANPSENHPKYISALPYWENSLTAYQYVSGAYILTTTEYMLNHPFNEDLKPGDAEDLDWFETHKPRLQFNRFTWVEFLKPRKWAVTMIPETGLDMIKECLKLN